MCYLYIADVSSISNMTTTVVSTTGVVIASLVSAGWANTLFASSRRARRLDEATRRVIFWDSWLKTLTLNGNQNNEAYLRAERGLNETAAAVEKLFRKVLFLEAATLESYKKYREAQPLWRKILLAYQMPSDTTQLWRLEMWIGVPISGLWLYILYIAHYKGPLHPWVVLGLSCVFTFIAHRLSIREQDRYYADGHKLS